MVQHISMAWHLTSNELERKPIGQLVLGYMRNGQYNLVRLEQQDVLQWRDYTGVAWQFNDVLAWMALPSPPRVDAVVKCALADAKAKAD